MLVLKKYSIAINCIIHNYNLFAYQMYDLGAEKGRQAWVQPVGGAQGEEVLQVQHYLTTLGTEDNHGTGGV